MEAESTPSSEQVGAPSSSPALRIASTVVLGALGLYALFSLIVLNGIMAYDGFWHLLVGRVISESGTVPRADFFCFTADGLAWNNLNWLAQLIAYRLYLWGGYDGPLLLSSCLFTGALVACLLNCRQRGALALPALAATALAFFAFWLPYGIRPRVWSFALIAVFAALLAPGKDQGGHSLRGLLWRGGALLGLLWLWNNLHGGFVYGYGLLGFVWAGDRLDAARRDGWRELLRDKTSYVIPGVVLLGFAGFLLHPHGLGALQHALVYPSRFHPEVWPMTAELQPFFYAVDPKLIAVLVGYVLLVAGGVALAWRRVRFVDLLPAVIFLVLTLRVRRGLTPLLIISAPWLAELWSHALRERLAPRVLASLERLAPAVQRLPLLLALGVLAYLPFGAARLEPGVPGALEGAPSYRHQLPSEAVGLIRDLPLHGRIFNQYELGGIIAWGLHPSKRVFIDGRMDLHSRSQSWLDYLTILRLEEGWQRKLDEHQIQLVLLRRGEPLLEVLARRHGWHVAHLDPTFVLLVRP